MIVDIFLKIAQNIPLSQSEMEELSSYISASHTTTAKITNMREIGELGYDLGEVWAGRFIASANPNNNDVASSTFTGTYMDAAGVTGKNAGTTQFSLSSADGKATAGGGSVALGASGLTITRGAKSDVISLKWLSTSKTAELVNYVSSGQNTILLDNLPKSSETGMTQINTKDDAGVNRAGISLGSAVTGDRIRLSSYNSSATEKTAIGMTESAITITGATTFNDNVTLGDAAGDTITFTGTPAGNIVSGTYTPTLTNSTNISSSTAAETHYARVGNVVTVGGKFTATATAAGTCAMGMSLPIASNFAATENLGGTAVGAQLWPAYARADSTNDRAVFVWSASNTTATDFFFTISYRII